MVHEKLERVEGIAGGVWVAAHNAQETRTPEPAARPPNRHSLGHVLPQLHEGLEQRVAHALAPGVQEADLLAKADLQDDLKGLWGMGLGGGSSRLSVG